MAEERLSIGDSQSEIDGKEDQGDLGSWCAQTIKSRAAPTGKASVAGLTFEPLDAIRAPLAITDQRVKGRFRVAEVVALGPWTGASGCADGLGAKRAVGALAFTLGQDTRFAGVADERCGMATATGG